MPRDNFATANSFMSSFMQGYGFVDNIQARKRNERRLEEELAIKRERQQRMDSLIFERARFNREDRAQAANMRTRANEARAIMASPNVDLSALQDYVDVPGVTDFIRGERQKAIERGQLQLGMQGDPSFQGQVAAAAQPQVAADPNDPTQLSTTQVTGDPNNLGVEPSAPAPSAMTPDLVNTNITQDELNTMVRNREITEEEAVRIRQTQSDNRLVQSVDASERGQAMIRRRERQRRQEAASDIQESVEDTATSFTDINDPDGDRLRAWPPLQATQWYHANRNNITDPTLQDNMDRMMEPRITASLEASRAIMMDDNIPTDSNEFQNAQRQFSRGLGLAQQMTQERDPPAIAGNDGRGVSRRNTAMVNNTIQAAGQGRPAPVPGNPNQHRAQIAVANRGNEGVKVSDAYANAAYGLLSRGVIDINIYSSMIRTGAPLGSLLAQQGIEQSIVQGDPTKDTFIDTVNPDGSISRQLIIPARRVPSLEDLQSQHRNTWADDAVNHLYNNLAPTYNTDDDGERGRRMVNTFLADLSANEAEARANGYSFQNRNDAALLFQRWSDFHVLQNSYDRELASGWFADPTFSQTYGSIDSRIFDRDFDAQMRTVIEEEGLETAGGNPLRLTPLKDIGGAEVQYLRQQYPDDTANMTDAQIIQAVQADQGR